MSHEALERTARAVVVSPCLKHGYEVLLADMLYPAAVITTTRSLRLANHICMSLALSARLRSLTLEALS